MLGGPGIALTWLTLSVAIMLAASIAAGPAGGQPAKSARVGVLASSTEVNFGPSVKVFREALRTAGWVEGQNLTLDVRYPGDQYAQLPELAAELVKLKADVLATLGTPATVAAKAATTPIPIVMESLSDVVSSGLVASLARPGGNLTGVSGFAPELNGKRLELIREILPRADRIGVLANRANPVTGSILRATESAAQRLRLTLHVLDVRQPADLARAFETMRRDRADALLLVADPMLYTERPQIVQLAARHRLPAVYEHRLFPETAASSRTDRSRRSGSGAWRCTWTGSCAARTRESCRSSSRRRSNSWSMPRRRPRSG
jgi:ABC-type uncharacterized transport system substrate-binding protein